MLNVLKSHRVQKKSRKIEAFERNDFFAAKHFMFCSFFVEHEKFVKRHKLGKCQKQETRNCGVH